MYFSADFKRPLICNNEKSFSFWIVENAILQRSEKSHLINEFVKQNGIKISGASFSQRKWKVRKQTFDLRCILVADFKRPLIFNNEKSFNFWIVENAIL